ncbi:MAG: XdhC family protein [Spirochaetales bacterium]|nr:XdhC family protein [Spirochaetales bacterium]
MNILKKIAEFSDDGTPFVLATITKAAGSSPAKPGFRLAVSGRGQSWGTIGGGALEKTIIDEAIELLEGSRRLASAELREIDLSGIGMQCGGSVELLLEHFGGHKSFIIFGGGHLGRALSPILELLDYKVTVFDNRDDVRSMIDSENRTVIIANYSDISTASEALRASGGCFIATHGHEWDLTTLRQILKTAPELPYIGMIGSKVKVRTILKTLKSEGFELPPGLHTPVGLRIGGDTAAEIAISIAAEFIAVNNGKDAPHMRIGTDQLG